MQLLPDINEAATISNVRQFFDVEVERIARIAHEDMGGLKSPTMSDMPRSETFGNSVESWLNKQIKVRIIFDKIKTAIIRIK